MPIPRLSVLMPIRVQDPINWEHPLNQGRLAWWLGIPPLDGGQYFYDLCAKAPATLTSMGNSSNGWRGPEQSGGYTSLLLDGTAGYMAVGAPPHLQLQPPFTLAAWVKCTRAKDYNAAIAFTDVFNNANTCYSLVVRANGAVNADRQNGTPVATAASVITANLWYRIVAVYTAAGTTIYVNGLAITTGTAASGLTYTSKTLQLGTYIAGGAAALYNGKFQGRLDDISVWGRALSAADVRADYDLSQQSYPDVLNRYTLPTPAGALAAITGAGLAWEGGTKATGIGAVSVAGAGLAWEGGTKSAGSGAVAIAGAGAAWEGGTLSAGAGGVSISGAGTVFEGGTYATGLGTTGSAATFAYTYLENSIAPPPTSYAPTAFFDDFAPGDTTTWEEGTGSLTYGPGCDFQVTEGIISASAECVPYATITAVQFTWLITSTGGDGVICALPPDPPMDPGLYPSFGAEYSADGVVWIPLTVAGDIIAPDGTATLVIPGSIIARYVHVWVKAEYIVYDQSDTITATARISDFRLTATTPSTEIIGTGAAWEGGTLVRGAGTIPITGTGRAWEGGTKAIGTGLVNPTPPADCFCEWEPTEEPECSLAVPTAPACVFGATDEVSTTWNPKACG